MVPYPLHRVTEAGCVLTSKARIYLTMGFTSKPTFRHRNPYSPAYQLELRNHFCALTHGDILTLD